MDTPQEVMKQAQEGDFVEFERNIKAALQDKMTQHPIVQQHLNKLDNMQQKIDQFKSIKDMG